MSKQRLLETLEQLQAELAEMERVDDDTRTALKQVTDAIVRRLELGEQATGDDPTVGESADKSPASQLQDFILGVEADHPELTRALNQVSAALANLGI